MSNPQGDQSIFKKFLKILAGKPEEEEQEQEEGLYAPRKELPIDELFAKNFTDAGGLFLYCSDEVEAYDNLKKIIFEVNASGILCHEAAAEEMLQKAGMASLIRKENAEVFLCTCEYAVAHDGGVMVTYKQLNGVKLPQLPSTFTLIVKTSQLVGKLSDAMTGIKENHKGDIPTQITSIKPPAAKSLDKQQSPDEVKNVFVLLIEDTVK
jgi:L-lactate utilization protein LutB